MVADPPKHVQDEAARGELQLPAAVNRDVGDPTQDRDQLISEISRLWQDLVEQNYVEKLKVYKTSARILLESCTLSLYVNTTGGPGFPSLAFKDAGIQEVAHDHNWIAEVHSSLRNWSHWDIVTSLVNSAIIKATLERLHQSCSAFCRLKDDRRTEDVVISQPISLYSNDMLIFSPHVRETIDAIQCMVSSRKHIALAMGLAGSKAWPLINLLDEVRPYATSRNRLRANVVRTLRELCMLHGYLPRSYIIPAHDIQSSCDVVRHGQWADVRAAEHGGRAVAVKKFRGVISDTHAVRKEFCKEAILWKQLSHPNIVKFAGISDSKTSFCIISSWMEHGSVMSYLEKNPNANRLDLILDVTKGLEYLHLNGLLHGDIKGANILVNHELHACLSDIGLAPVIFGPYFNQDDQADADSIVSISPSSIRWSAPELMQTRLNGGSQSSHTLKSDIYSLGMTMWEVFTDNIPFHDHPLDRMVTFLVCHQQKRPSRAMTARPRGLSDAVWHLMEMCWHQDPTQRPSASLVIEELESEADNQSVPTLIDADFGESVLWSSTTDSVLRVMEMPISTPKATSNNRIYRWRSSPHALSDNFQIVKILRRQHNVYDVAFLHDEIALISERGFEIIDLHSIFIPWRSPMTQVETGGMNIALRRNAIALPKFEWSARHEDGTVVFAAPVGSGRMPIIALSDIGYYARYMFDNRATLSGAELKVTSDIVSWDEVAATFTKVTAGRPFAGEPSVGEGSITWHQNFSAWWAMWRDNLLPRDLDGSRRIHPQAYTLERWMVENKYGEDEDALFRWQAKGFGGVLKDAADGTIGMLPLNFDYIAKL
ncbi:kinase-like protein [Wolfiporia cocos MD-104 SS10]|uniref:Kinase-like protein n=1 Tax=Wolfiporia cocos (strain MD-104) TaxID=742152 RepID=A0A2H3JRJ5_WOLCO|nr:kinase-like protein [Wolfiporia cocos MD-104 SS10]